MNKKDCFGCVSYDNYTKCCELFFEDEIYKQTTEFECPCINCIVKGVCDDGCDTFWKFVEQRIG
jgi:hypothetical protein